MPDQNNALSFGTLHFLKMVDSAGTGFSHGLSVFPFLAFLAFLTFLAFSVFGLVVFGPVVFGLVVFGFLAFLTRAGCLAYTFVGGFGYSVRETQVFEIPLPHAYGLSSRWRGATMTPTRRCASRRNKRKCLVVPGIVEVENCIVGEY